MFECVGAERHSGVHIVLFPFRSNHHSVKSEGVERKFEVQIFDITRQFQIHSRLGISQTGNLNQIFSRLNPVEDIASVHVGDGPQSRAVDVEDDSRNRFSGLRISDFTFYGIVFRGRLRENLREQDKKYKNESLHIKSVFRFKKSSVPIDNNKVPFHTRKHRVQI